MDYLPSFPVSLNKADAATLHCIISVVDTTLFNDHRYKGCLIVAHYLDFIQCLI
jgi:hypothetical protein